MAKVRVVQVLELGVETEVEVISTTVEPVCEETVEEAAAPCCEEKPVEEAGAKEPCGGDEHEE